MLDVVSLAVRGRAYMSLWSVLVDSVGVAEMSTSTTDVIARLAESGLSPDMIAHALDRPRSEVRQVIVSLRQSPPAPVLDEQMTDEVRQLAAMCLREARLMIEFGAPDTRLAIIKSVLPALSRHIAQPGEDNDDVRGEWERMLEEMRDVPEIETIVTETDIIEVEASE